MVSGMLIYTPASLWRWISNILIVAAIGLVSLILNRIGHTKIASYVLPGFLFIHILRLTYTGGGTSLPGIMGYVPIVLTTGFLLGRNKGLVMAFLCIAATFGIAALEVQNLLPEFNFSRSPVGRAIALSQPLCITAAIQFFAAAHIENAYRELGKSESNLQAIMSTTDVGYLLVDDRKKIISFNKAAQDFVELELNSTVNIGDGLASFFRKERWAEGVKMADDALAGNKISYEVSNSQPDGTINYYRVNMAPIGAESPFPGLLVGLSNITGLKNAENEIRSLNETLEAKVEERTAKLLEANRQLEAFSYTVSNDLQAPLQVINGYGNLLLHTQSAKLDREGRDFLAIIGEKVNQMSQLIHDLLQFSKSGKSPLHLVEVNMKEMVNEVVNEIRLANYGSKITLKIGGLPNDKCDPALMRQVWANLISNAVKFSAKVALPSVEIGSELRGGVNVYFVKDNGVGFDMEHADKLFKVFNRLHFTEDFQGAGVGLATAKRIIDKHEGKIWAYARPNEGAAFYFTLS